jgi:hypothetical protein
VHARTANDAKHLIGLIGPAVAYALLELRIVAHATIHPSRFEYFSQRPQ